MHSSTLSEDLRLGKTCRFYGMKADRTCCKQVACSSLNVRSWSSNTFTKSIFKWMFDLRVQLPLAITWRWSQLRNLVAALRHYLVKKRGLRCPSVPTSSSHRESQRKLCSAPWMPSYARSDKIGFFWKSCPCSWQDSYRLQQGLCLLVWTIKAHLRCVMLEMRVIISLYLPMLD